MENSIVSMGFVLKKGIKMSNNYTDINSKVIDEWCDSGWEWGREIDHETYLRAKNGDWGVLLTPTKPVPKEWFCDMKSARVLGLASGGGQQMPVFAALGAKCTVLDYSQKMLDREREVAGREGYEIEIVRADMTRPLPFEDGSFDLIFHPVSNCYVEEVYPIWRECARVLKRGGILLAGFDSEMKFAFDNDEKGLKYKLPFNPLKDAEQYKDSMENDWGMQFSHTMEELIGGQLKAGFVLKDIYSDTDREGRLAKFNIPVYFATKSVKE